MTYTWTLVVLMNPLGSLGAIRSVKAMRAATTNATVVKKPKVFCTLTSELCMAGS